MTIETEILKELAKIDHFHNESPKVQGIAQRAIDSGHETMSDGQKTVVGRFLKMRCPGIKDPGRNHNNCQHTLEGEPLLNAIIMSRHYRAILCEHCRNESDSYSAEREQLQAE